MQRQEDFMPNVQHVQKRRPKLDSFIALIEPVVDRPNALNHLNVKLRQQNAVKNTLLI
jgi:hypothetical protein